MSKKLLLADDSITIQKVIGITFANEDYDLTVVDNGEAALAKARELHPDLVLADVFMPGKNGYELCAAIKQDSALAGTPVLLLTGTFEPFDEDKARSAGADSWIAKPFESQALIDRVEQLLAAAAVAPAAVAEFEPEPLASAEPAPAEPLAKELIEEPAAATAVQEEDPWGTIAFDEEDLQAKAPELEEEFLFEEDLPPLSEAVTTEPEVPAAAEVVAAAEPDWGDFEEEVLPLDENDILEAEELVESGDREFVFAVEEPVESAVAQPAATEPAAEEPAEEEEFLFEEDLAAPAAVEELEMEAAFAAEPETHLAAETGEWDFPAEEEAAAAEPAAETEWDFDLAKSQPAAAPEPEAPAAPPVTKVPPAPAAAPEPVAAPPHLTQGVEERVAALSEAELEQIVEKVAGAVVERLAATILEKIAWEVVPDLAESLIREEIRKIKEKTV